MKARSLINLNNEVLGRSEPAARLNETKMPRPIAASQAINTNNKKMNRLKGKRAKEFSVRSIRTSSPRFSKKSKIFIRCLV